MGYAFDQIGGIECILDRFANSSNLNGRIAGIVASLGIGSAAQLANALRSGALSARLARAGIVLTVLQATKIMYDFGQAGNWCREEVCVSTADKIEVEHTRSVLNPCRYLIDETYTTLECPDGSDEIELNEDGEAVRTPEETVVLPDPPDGDVLVWPRPPQP